MNYGDGWYGGVYVGAMYALAFTSNDVPYVVEAALKTIPTGTKYHDCISDVIRWHKQYPNDWKQAWFEIQRKWTDDIGCPDGVFSQFNIDATVNSAYVVLGLLYGNGDFSKTIEISTRAGQDADCNPSTAAGILGTMLGYEAIPDYWKKGLADAEDLNFKYTDISLRKAYDMSYRHALENIKRNGGKVDANSITIKTQKPVAVRWEQSFTGVYPYKKQWIDKPLEGEHAFKFTGNGFVVKGECKPKQGSMFDADVNATATVEMVVDNGKPETIALPASFTTRRHELAWKYALPEGEHTVILRLKSGGEAAVCYMSQLLLYQAK
jgi:ADP-ribosylglycohydrolase